MDVCVGGVCGHEAVPLEARRGRQVFWSWSYRRLQVPLLWGLETKWVLCSTCSTCAAEPSSQHLPGNFETQALADPFAPNTN